MRFGRKKRSFRIPYARRILYSILIALILSLIAWVQQTIQSKASIHDPNGEIASLYANQSNDDLTQLYSSAIKSAQESIFLNVYTLTDPTIIRALKNRSEHGVNVQVITDAKESPYVTSKLGPYVNINRRFSDGRMHQKILVIDGKESWIGSANMTSESLRMHGNLVTAINSKPFAEHLRNKAMKMAYKGHTEFFQHENFTIGGQLIELWFLPDDQQAVHRIKEIIRTAKKQLRIAMFTWTRMDFAHAVIEAANRGIDVEVVIDNNQGKGASSRVVELFKNSKVKVAISPGGPLLHYKFMLVDDTTLVTGSANWTRDAFYKNDECFIIIHNLVPAQQRKMETLWNVISKESIPIK